MAEAVARREYASRIQSRLLGMGYGVMLNRILRNYRVFVSWYEGRLAFGYLIRQTGIRRNIGAESYANGGREQPTSQETKSG